MTRAPTIQHISERINLISAQHNLGPPSKEVASLLLLAFEVRIFPYDDSRPVGRQSPISSHQNKCHRRNAFTLLIHSTGVRMS